MIKVDRSQKAFTASIPAPIGGLNARDPYAAMPATDAVILDNFFCLPNEIMLRKGCSDWVTGITGMVESICGYNTANGSHKIFAAAGSNIYDATLQGAVGAAVQTGLTNARWEHANFATAGGKFLYMVNGADKPRLYDGTNWTAVDNASTPSITGVTTTLLKDVMVHQSRLWFIEANSLKVWYLPPLSIGGAAQSFDLGSIFVRGGYLQAFESWSLDAGSGLDDHAVFISSEGEVAVYRGTDPSSAATWFKVGVFYMGSPIGQRSANKYAGDVMVVCQDGLNPLSKALLTARITTKTAITDKIQSTISDAVTEYGTLFGWETVVYAGLNQLILNVPTSSVTSVQYVMNTITGAWSRFTNWNAFSWELVNDNIYFGTNGKVCLAWSGTQDSGATIVANALPAFNYFGKQSQLKQVTMCRPIVSTDGTPSILIGINTEFNSTDPTGVLSYTPSASSMIWGSMVWGSMAWGGSLVTKANWQYASGLGYSLSLHMIVQNNNANFRWQSTDYVIKGGGIL